MFSLSLDTVLYRMAPFYPCAFFNSFAYAFDFRNIRFLSPSPWGKSWLYQYSKKYWIREFRCLFLESFFRALSYCHHCRLFHLIFPSYWLFSSLLSTLCNYSYGSWLRIHFYACKYGRLNFWYFFPVFDQLKFPHISCIYLSIGSVRFTFISKDEKPKRITKKMIFFKMIKVSFIYSMKSEHDYQCNIDCKIMHSFQNDYDLLGLICPDSKNASVSCYAS